MSNNPVVKVRNVQRPIWPKLHVHRPKPRITRTQKIWHLFSKFCRSMLLNPIPIHPTRHHIAQQKISLKIRRPHRLLTSDQSRNRRRPMVVRQHLRRIPQPIMRLPKHWIKSPVNILINRHRMAVRGKKIAQRIKTQPKDIRLPIPILLDARPLRPKSKGSPTHPKFPPIAPLHHRLVRHPLTPIHPPIKPSPKVVRHVVRVIGRKRSQNHFPLVRSTIAIPILQPRNVRNRKNHRPILVGRHRVGHR